MAIISSLKLPIFPKATEICSMTRQTATTTYPSKNKNIILKKGTRIDVMSAVQQSSVKDETIVKVEPVEERVRRIKEMIVSKSLKSYLVEDLVMINAIQRLGLQYSFQNEIGVALRRRYERCGTEEGNRDLHDTALVFRLLRQHGYNVSADCFSKFKDDDGNFKQELEKDSKGLMSLYEAFQMRVPGDHTLDNAGEFSAHLLQEMKNIEPSTSSIIVNTLTNPYHKSLPRFTAMDFLHNFQSSIKSLHNVSDESNWIVEMQYLAAMDIDITQINHKREITQISRWWKGLRLTEELKLRSIQCIPGGSEVVRLRTHAFNSSTDEYLKKGIVSCGVGIAYDYLFLLSGRGGNKGGKVLANRHTETVSLVATIFRLWNDLGSAKVENQNGYDWSYLACYMNEHKGSSTESAREHVHTLISDAWTCLNETCQSSPFSAYFKEAVLNATRMLICEQTPVS